MKRLLIDLEKCAEHEHCGAQCVYTHHPENDGVTSLREMAHFGVVCRRCSDEPCVRACPQKALEKQKDKVLKRYTMRCTSCKTCSYACPFGTIYPETIPYLVSRCDLCLGKIPDGEKPKCVATCGHGYIQYGDFEENSNENVYRLSENILVKSDYQWERDLRPVKK